MNLTLLKDGIWVGVCALLLASFTVMQWSAELQPALVLAAFAGLPLACVKILFGDAATKGRRMVPMVVWLLLFGLPLGAWAWPEARRQVAGWVARAGLETPLLHCMEDPDVETAARCCRALERRRLTVPQAALTSHIKRSGEATPMCLVSSVDGSRPSATMALSNQARRWEQTLRSAPELDRDPKRACMLASKLKATGHIPSSFGPERLLRCALSAQTAAARGCCAQALRSHVGTADLADSVHSVEGMHAGVRRELAPLLVEHALLQTSAERDDMRSIYDLLDLRAPPQRRWALHLACATLSRDRRSGVFVVDELEAFVSHAGQCEIGAPSLRAWSNACAAVTDTPALADSTNIAALREALCRELSGRGAPVVMSAARAKVRRAHDRARRVNIALDDKVALLLDYGAARRAGVEEVEPLANPKNVLTFGASPDSSRFVQAFMDLVKRGQAPMRMATPLRVAPPMPKVGRGFGAAGSHK